MFTTLLTKSPPSKEVDQPRARMAGTELCDLTPCARPCQPIPPCLPAAPDRRPFENLTVDAAGDQVLTVITPQPGSPEHDAIQLERSLPEPRRSRELLEYLSSASGRRKSGRPRSPQPARL